MDCAIKLENLTKNYGDKRVLHSVNMNVKQGDIYGFVGPNGAGKSTVMKCLLGLIDYDEGDISILNSRVCYSDQRYLKNIGALIEEPIFYGNLTALENLQLQCRYMGCRHEMIEVYLKKLSIWKVKDNMTSTFSVGMKQRLGIARALVSEPKILILDEPLNGLDPNGIYEIRELLHELQINNNVTILISSHILSELEMIANTVGIIQDGQIVTECKKDRLMEKQTYCIELEVMKTKEALILIRNMQTKENVVLKENIIYISNTEINCNDWAKFIIKNNLGLKSICNKKMSLEEYFFKVTNKEDGE